MSLTRQDKFNICASFTLSNDDLSCLNLLYLPIIGSESLALYMMLHSLICRSSMDSGELEHTFILDMLNISVTEFLNDRKILEGIGLLSTLENAEGYLYLLNPPISPKKFLNSNVHGLILFSTVGEDNFKILREKFQIKKINKALYKDISASYDEVFASYTPNEKIKDDDAYLLDKKEGKGIKIKNFDFNFKTFLSSIDTYFLSGGVTKEFEDLIIQTALNYSFDEADMISLYKDSIDSTQVFSEKVLKRKAKVLFKFKTNEELPKFEVKKEREVDLSEKTFIEELESLTGEEFLSELMGESYDPKYLTELNELYNTINLNPSVIKLMVMHVFKIMKDKNGRIEFPAISYFKKVADEWILNGYTDTGICYNYIMGKLKPKKENKKYYPKRTIKKTGKYAEENKKKNFMDRVEVL